MGPLGSLDIPQAGASSWYAAGGPVSWAQVRALNERGASVLSRAVMLDPPPPSQIPDEIGTMSGGTDSATVATLPSSW